MAVHLTVSLLAFCLILHVSNFAIFRSNWPFCPNCHLIRNLQSDLTILHLSDQEVTWRHSHRFSSLPSQVPYVPSLAEISTHRASLILALSTLQLVFTLVSLRFIARV